LASISAKLDIAFSDLLQSLDAYIGETRHCSSFLFGGGPITALTETAF